MEEKLLTPEQVCSALNVSIQTLRLWDESGKLPAIRTPGQHRRYRESDIYRFIGIKKEQNNTELPVAIYSRVSSQEQKTKGDLDRQKARLLDYCVAKKYKVEYIFTEVGSGMSDSRPKLLQLFKLVVEKKISVALIEHRDRLGRFNYKIYEYFFNSYGVRIEYMEETLPKTNDAELVEDMLSLMASFSAKIYGRSAERSQKK